MALSILSCKWKRANPIQNPHWSVCKEHVVYGCSAPDQRKPSAKSHPLTYKCKLPLPVSTYLPQATARKQQYMSLSPSPLFQQRQLVNHLHFLVWPGDITLTKASYTSPPPPPHPLPKLQYMHKLWPLLSPAQREIMKDAHLFQADLVALINSLHPYVPECVDMCTVD